MQQNPNIHILELAAHVLEPLLNELILVGGCAVGLLITDSTRPPIRPTVDVDLLTEVTPLSNYYDLCEKLKILGFRENPDLICRWSKNELVIDIMPTDKAVLGFSNRWHKLASQMPENTILPSGLKIQHISAPLIIASKIESFHDRGNGDYFHHDIEDTINLIDGREEIVIEIRNSPVELKQFIEGEIDDLIGDTKFIDCLPGLLNPEPNEQQRVTNLIGRLRIIAGL